MLAWYIIIFLTCVDVVISYPYMYGVHRLNEAIVSDGWRITNLTAHELLSSPMGGSCMTGKARLSSGAPTWSWVWGGQIREKIEPSPKYENLGGGTVLPLREELATGGGGVKMETFP